ncbi:MAG: hypothetical protein JRE64_00780 [Deltaproteobacteria bacterium]|nr:hypothetical protein [Deltaproteobacteria bacterium]
MDLVITSLGMLSSVGHNVVTSCASIRAGLTRRREISYFSELDLDTQDSTPIIGCPIHGYTEGFVIPGLWVRMALSSLNNLVEYGRLPDRTNTRFWSKTGIIGVTPPPYDPRLGADEDCTSEDVKEAYLHSLLDVFNYPILQYNLGIICTGHSGAIAAIGQAELMMAVQDLERIIVVAVDSYLDPMSLDWLDEHRRLKTSENPAGLTPGEAGACFMLESRNSCQSRGASLQACVKKSAVATENDHYFTDKQNQGVALSAVIIQAFSKSSVTLPFAGKVISNLNGEQWRAYELGVARVRATESLSPMSDFIYPCDSLGEIGAASGTVAICIATRLLQCGYVREDAVLVSLSSDYGQVGAVYITRE